MAPLEQSSALAVIMSSKLGRVLLLCDQALLDMRQLTNKVTILEQCYVGEGIDGRSGIADLNDTEVALIQQVIPASNLHAPVTLCALASLTAGRRILHMSSTAT